MVEAAEPHTDAETPAGPGTQLKRLVKRNAEGRIVTEYVVTPERDVQGLAEDLSQAIQGEVRFDNGSRALYATDSSNYREVPIGVVLPKSRADVIKTVEICRKHDVPIMPRGGGTSLAGQCCNAAVVIDFSKYLDHVIAIDPENRLARVEPGCILDTLRAEAAKHGLTFGPDPATHDHNTLGGMIGNDSGGVHALMNGITVYNVQALDILTYDGLVMTVGPTSDADLRAIRLAGGRRAEIYRRLDALYAEYAEQIRERFPDIPRRVSGYENLDELAPEKGRNVAHALVGTEGTCVIVLEATLNLIPNPKKRVVVGIGFPDIYEAADAVPRVLKHNPIGLEGFDQILIDRYKLKGLHAKDLEILPKGCGWLLVELGADNEEAAVAAGKALVADFENDDGVTPKAITSDAEQATIWRVRDDALGAESYVPNHPDTWPGWEDSAVHPDNLGDYLRELRALFKKYGYGPCVYGHFGQGLVHCTIAFDLYDEPGIDAWRAFLDEAADLVVKYNGSFSGEHGDGQARAELLVKMYGPELMKAFREFKSIWDPKGRMNPGKIVEPYPITSDLRVGPVYTPPHLETYFTYPADKGSFARAAQRCVGVGKCRRHDSGHEVMCPSYLVTHEERYTTRGRARLLFEMLHGGPIDNRWASDAVEEALNFCLACKGCKKDCPVSVDMATYKAEFRAHHYKGRLRPRVAYSMGLIHRWARWASAVPWLANFATQTPGLSSLAKAAAGIASQRPIPPFAKQSFAQWFRQSEGRGGQRGSVVLWPDTFNNYLRPNTAIAATKVLEAAGFDVIVPDRVCCGRALFDWGMLDTARKLLRRTLKTLRPELEAGTPIIGLEPACLATFRDELINLFPHDPLAKRLHDQSVFFSDFVAKHAQHLGIVKTGRKALVQTHCHHHAVIGAEGEKKLLDALGIEANHVPSGCCGMAGSFGFAADTYEVGLAAGERVLLPAVRAASSNTLILADGYSCREQIEQGTGRATLHAADLVLQSLQN